MAATGLAAGESVSVLPLPRAYRWGWVRALELKRFPISIFFSRSVDVLGPAPSSGLVWLSETTTFPRLIEDNKREKHKARAGCVDGALGACWELAAGIKRYKVYFYLCFLICLLCNSISIYLSQSVPISALRSVCICAPSHLWQIPPWYFQWYHLPLWTTENEPPLRAEIKPGNIPPIQNLQASSSRAVVSLKS